MEDGIHASDSGPPSDRQTRLSVVVPFYNASDLVPEVVRRLKSALKKITTDYEIILVNDGSSDNTLEYLKKEAECDSRIRLITYEKNMGKGYAVRYGIGKSFGTYVVYIDGDLDILPDSLDDYINSLHRSDVAVASRRHPLSRANLPASRKLLSKAFNLLVRVMTGISLSDTQVGLKAGRGVLLRAIFGIMTVNRYAFDVEFLAIASRLGLRIVEMPIQASTDKQFRFRQVLKMLKDLILITYRLRMRLDFKLIAAHIRMSTRAEIQRLTIAQVRDLLKSRAIEPPPEIEKTVE